MVCYESKLETFCSNFYVFKQEHLDNNNSAILFKEKEELILWYTNLSCYDYVQSGDKMIKKNVRINNEFYVCPIYNGFIFKKTSQYSQGG